MHTNSKKEMNRKMDPKNKSIKPEFETRLLEFRAVGEEGKMVIEGYAITFDQTATHSARNYKFTETISRGALEKTDMKDVPLRYNHNDNVLLMARTRGGSLKLLVDEIGLKIVAELIDTQSNRDIYKSIQAGQIDKMSFAFTVSDGGDTWTFKDDETIRVVNKIEKLWDVSVVDTPFYDATSIYARSVSLLESEKHRLDSRKSDELVILKLKAKLKGKI